VSDYVPIKHTPGTSYGNLVRNGVRPASECRRRRGRRLYAIQKPSSARAGKRRRLGRATARSKRSVLEPDEVIFEERWASGEWFRSSAIWKLEKGRVFYFRPGHETYRVFMQALPLLILTNAVRWLPSRS
jgi:trehalose utilization protein